MAKVITFSRYYSKGSLYQGKPTYFVEKLVKSVTQLGYELPYFKSFPLSFLESLSGEYFDPKHHTIRKGKRWKAGDYMSPRVWGNDINPKSGKSGPYHSKQITICNDILITNVYDISISNTGLFFELTINGKLVNEQDDLFKLIAINDGLTVEQFKYLFNQTKFEGQIICWKKDIYESYL